MSDRKREKKPKATPIVWVWTDRYGGHLMINSFSTEAKADAFFDGLRNRKGDRGGIRAFGREPARVDPELSSFLAKLTDDTPRRFTADIDKRDEQGRVRVNAGFVGPMRFPPMPGQMVEVRDEEGARVRSAKVDDVLTFVYLKIEEPSESEEV